jgi:hypothetical protein
MTILIAAQRKLFKRMFRDLLRLQISVRHANSASALSMTGMIMFGPLHGSGTSSMTRRYR